MVRAGMTASELPYRAIRSGRSCCAAKAMTRIMHTHTAYTAVPRNIPRLAAFRLLAAKARCHISAPAMVMTR